jgi:hypothetical protein
VGYTFERIYRNASNTVLYAVMMDNGARHIVIRRWPVQDAGSTPVVAFFFGDQTDRLRAVWTGGEMAKHFSRGRTVEAMKLLQKEGFEQEQPIPEVT